MGGLDHPFDKRFSKPIEQKPEQENSSRGGGDNARVGAVRNREDEIPFHTRPACKIFHGTHVLMRTLGSYDNAMRTQIAGVSPASI